MRRFLFCSLTLAATLGATPPAPVELIVRGGTVYPGGAAPFVGDVAIRGDRIVATARHIALPAKRIFDARGLIVAPGFIDPHSHVGDALADTDPQQRLIPAFLMQGVTTAFIGNDGGGSPEVARTLGSAKERPVGVNFATYVGFGAVRQAVIGAARRAPTEDELAQEKALVVKGMCEGAVGFSTGLFYPPQSFSETGEVVALAREAALRDGIYDSHIRDESSYGIGLEGAIREALRIGREAGLPIHVSHIKALGVDVQGKSNTIIALIEAAQRSGQKVTADQYPWSASGTSLAAALIPVWAQDGGTSALQRRFNDPATLPKLRSDMADNLRRRGGAEALLITGGPDKGRTLLEIATARQTNPISAAIAVIARADPPVASFNQSEADIAAFMARPWVMTGSDASTGHPRVYGSFARKYAVYVKQRRVITLRQFIDRSSWLTARTFGLAGRGSLRLGAFADVVVFDPHTYAARATYAQPELTAAGVRLVTVNGRIAVADGRVTGSAAGKALAHRPPPGSCKGVFR